MRIPRVVVGSVGVRPIRRRTMGLLAVVFAVAAGTLQPAPGTQAADACVTDAGYLACGRAFPDPQAGMGLDPMAEGLIPSNHFIQFGLPGTGPSQIWDGLRLLEQRYDRFLRVWQLDDLLGDPGADSAGLWLAGQRMRSPVILTRVTDETVPAEGKRRFFFALSLHGIERAGVEGGTRALEDFVTYAFCESLGGIARAQANSACSKQNHVIQGPFAEGRGGYPARLLFWDEKSPTFGDVLKQAELYFAYVNPDGWHRGDLPTSGGVAHYQRYNGNGVDLNREWPTVGYTYAPYTPASEPEVRGLMRALRDRGGNWAGGIDLHGMSTASAFTYTMLPAGQFDYRMNQRIRRVAQRTQIDARARLEWSALIRSEGVDVGDVPAGGIVALPAQSWGTVWDTLGYTITGALGDWIASPDVGLGGLGMSNEMAYSHITNCGIGSCFLPDIEQLHVAGNKGLIYSQIDTTLRTEDTPYRLPYRGTLAYLAHPKVVTSDGTEARAPAPSSRRPQAGFTGMVACVGVATGSAFSAVTHCASDPFEVKEPSRKLHNGGIRVEIGHIATHSAEDFNGGSFELQRFVTDHGDEGEWETVARSNASGQAYANNSTTVVHNDPLPGRYRLYGRVLTPGVYTYEGVFTRAPGEAHPGQRPFRATNLDFFDELAPHLAPGASVRSIRAGELAADPGALDGVDTLVLADATLAEAAPGLAPRVRRGARASIEHWVRRGGRLILTDAAVRELRSLAADRTLAATHRDVFAGYVQFRGPDGTTYDDPLAEGMLVPGAAEGDQNRRQTYEPVPLGFPIGDGFIDDEDHAAPAWTVDATRFIEAGGRMVGGVGGATVYGELPHGRGTIRIIGALLPTPSDEADHRFGLRSYALTYGGWQIFENLLTVG